MKKRTQRSYSIDAAARLHAEANRTDPFAGRRMLMYLQRGIDSANEVAAEALRKINARGGKR